MSVTLDGERLFDKRYFEIRLASAGRAAVERSVPGLEGVLSIDLGGRGRVVKQKGALRAKSAAQMDERVAGISGYMDGETHTLVTGNGWKLDNLRMDVFEITKKRTDGSGLCWEYEIIYRQLRV